MYSIITGTAGGVTRVSCHEFHHGQCLRWTEWFDGDVEIEADDPRVVEFLQIEARELARFAKIANRDGIRAGMEQTSIR